MRGDGMRREPPFDIPDRELWRRSRSIDTAEDEAARFLDLAGFADRQLDPDEYDRVAEMLAADPDAAADIAAARVLAAAQTHEPLPERVIERAAALVGDGVPQAAEIVPFPPRRPAASRLQAMAHWGVQWGSLAAAVVIAGWLGFTLGMDVSSALAQNGRAADDSFLTELLDPSTGLTRDLTEGPQT